MVRKLTKDELKAAERIGDDRGLHIVKKPRKKPKA